ncbi:hypothetical protein EYF80_012453 [Liparis tanakae]|uniref:Uncharacterized protein n=1 Tax=Liparis tanakae TaxID=230148 RepID=A0A4Z2IH45_9TELE|nr:hypothetical protein EYF80_012453 [Liparis tanakae]
MTNKRIEFQVTAVNGYCLPTPRARCAPFEGSVLIESLRRVLKVLSRRRDNENQDAKRESKRAGDVKEKES